MATGGGDRFGAQWTPTILIVDREGQERHRIEGFLPADDLLSQLILGSAHAAFGAGDFAQLGDAEIEKSGIAAAFFLGGWMGPGPGWLDPIWMLIKIIALIFLGSQISDILGKVGDSI